ncbi:hypothetical protein [Gracilimonas sp.]|uniref:hypothetical protein n=1 Tax=Gracilimonas sp. TaxID=1974203 RepID=UPI00287153B3|nr:hypothetical protein [Gracilimonas sp.]
MRKALPYILPLLVGSALMFIPLLRDLHFESAMLAGTVGCFWGGLQAAKSDTRQDFFATLRILALIYIAAIPLFFYALFTGCLTIDGVGFWIFIPFPSAFFGIAVGRLIREFKFPFPKFLTVLILLFCAFGILMFEFFSFPQVYFYNHVWGLWPGPIYDEAVTLTGSFFYFRWLTLLWIILLWVLPNWSQNLQTKLITGFALLSLMFSYLNLDEAGIISPPETIQEQLGGYHQTEHFELFFDEDFYSDDEINYWSARHEFHFRQITELLEIDWPADRKIESYLYAHAWQKKDITGAKFTSYVPIWLEQDQLHIAKQQLDGVLKHEMVHVISKQFGNDLFNGSWSIGLVEGLAEGIAKDASPRSTLHQIVAGEKPWPDAKEMKTALSLRGFYGSAGAISYTKTGSFVEYLLDNHPIYSFKDAYRTNDFKYTYYQSIDSLVSGWNQTLKQTKLDSVDQQVSEFIFAQRSLFEKTCPHSISEELRLWDRYQFQLANQDTATAHKVLDELYQLTPQNDWIQDEWVRVQLRNQNFQKAAEAISKNDTLLTLQVLKSDALFLSRGYEAADSLLQSIAPEIESSNQRNFRYTLILRENQEQWSSHVNRRYLDLFPDSADFASLNLPNQMLTIQKATDQKLDDRLLLYSSLLLGEEQNPYWYEVYEDVIHQLIWLKEWELAEEWIHKTTSIPDLRLRYRERLKEQQEWLQFLKNYPVAD